MFDFYFNTRVKFGAGARKVVPEILQKHQWKKVGIVVDHNLVDIKLIQELLKLVEKNSERCIIGKCEISEPTYDSLEKTKALFTGKNLQVFIGVGGGSALDMAKAMAVLQNNLGPAITYRGFDKMTEPVLPVIAIPTTAGTGSEVTPNASFIDSVEKKKMGINGESIRPAYAFLDPELTLSCPKSPSISAGVDSMVHATEALVAKKSNSMAKLFACEGFKKVFQNINKVVNHPENLEYRTEVMWGAFLSGIALMNSGTGPAAAMSYPLGVHYKVPHGIGGGIFLPLVIKKNIEKGFWDYAELYDYLVDKEEKIDKKEKANKFLSMMFTLWKVLDMPDNLKKFNVLKSGIPLFVQETLQLKGALDQNPVPFYEEEITIILNELTA